MERDHHDGEKREQIDQCPEAQTRRTTHHHIQQQRRDGGTQLDISQHHHPASDVDNEEQSATPRGENQQRLEQSATLRLTAVVAYLKISPHVIYTGSFFVDFFRRATSKLPAGTIPDFRRFTDTWQSKMPPPLPCSAAVLVPRGPPLVVRSGAPDAPRHGTTGCQVGGRSRPGDRRGG